MIVIIRFVLAAGVCFLVAALTESPSYGRAVETSGAAPVGADPATQEHQGLTAVAVPRPDVRIAPGDVIDIKFFYVPELNESQMVRADGRIALQLVGIVDVQGKSPEQVREELYESYAPHLKKPDVIVIVRSQIGRRIFVTGEVLIPGAFPLPGPTTVLESVMQAGGFNIRTAQVKNVIVIRHKDGQRFGASLDLRAALKGDPAEPFYLEPLDIVYVPRTTVTKVAHWIDSHINQLVPMLGLEYSKVVSDGVLTIDLTRGRPVR